MTKKINEGNTNSPLQKIKSTTSAQTTKKDTKK
jgi:hypothetical protein